MPNEQISELVEGLLAGFVAIERPFKQMGRQLQECCELLELKLLGLGKLCVHHEEIGQQLC